MSRRHGPIPATHPYVIEIELDPADYGRFCRLAEDAPELRILDTDQSLPDAWTVRVACASTETASRLQDAW